MYVKSHGQDPETDVIVVGTGPAGLTSVASAVACGAKTVAIEAHEHIGGNGLYSTGWVAFVDSKLQKELGIQDSVELFMKDCSKLLDVTSGLYGLYWDQELSKLYAQESSKMYDILTDRGVRFTRLIKRPLQTSVDRLAAVEDTSMFPEAFAAEFAGPDVRTYLKSLATRLIFGDSSVRGVYVESADGQAPAFKIRARKAVILASGGYGANPRLRRHFQTDPANLSIYAGLHTCRGDGHLMGQAVGGDLVNMTMIPPIVSVSSQLTEESIAVNVQGNRFHDEAGPYYDRVYALKKQDQKRAFYIFDSSTFDRKSKYVNQMAGDLRKADTVAELACKLSLPTDALERSVQQWNDFMASGLPADTLTGRVQFRPDRPQIAQPPFYSKVSTLFICAALKHTTCCSVFRQHLLALDRMC